MKKIKFIKVCCIAFSCLALFSSCEKDDDKSPQKEEEKPEYVKESFGENDVIFSSTRWPKRPIGDKLELKESNTFGLCIGDSTTCEFAEYKKSLWYSSDENIVTLSQKEGKEVTITAKSMGEATIQVTDEAGKKTLSLKVYVDAAYTADIYYNLGMMKDLLQFVTPEVIFTEDGVEKYKYVLSEDDFVAQDSLDIDGIKYETKKLWGKTVHYTRWGLKTDMVVRYIPKQNVEMDKEEYDFRRKVWWNSAISYDPSYHTRKIEPIEVSIDLTINITDNGVEIKTTNKGKVLKESVADYIQQLAAHPDTLRSQITEDGKVEKIKK